MTPERWNQISAIFDAVLELAPHHRDAFLREACAGDQALRTEIERMLDEDERTQKLLDRPVMPPSKPGNNHAANSINSQTTEGELTGKLIQGRFCIKARLGAGGMGEVYLAEDPKLKRCVALKRLPARMRSDERYRTNLLREARRASSLTDPHIAQVYDVLETDGEAFLVMEYIEGATLRHRIATPLAPAELLDVAVQCAEGLLAAHQKGVVHCDIKPENIMLTPAGLVKILDFGIAKRLPTADTGATTSSVGPQGLIGTPDYMAPEVLAGDAPDARSDIYSLGVTLFEAGTGRHPRQPAAPVRVNGDRRADGRTTLPAAIAGIIAAMLDPVPARRYAGAAELLRDLRSARDSCSSNPIPQRVRAGVSGRRVVTALGAALLVAMLAWVAVAYVQPRFYRWLHPVPQQKQVAVLPFSVAGADASTRAFADGLCEVVSAKLTQLTERPQFQVIPVSEVRARHVATAADARKEFGVNLVIEGTWQQVGGAVHVVPVLIDTATNRQLRANEFVAAVGDPIGLESEVAAGVLKMLEIELQPREQPSFNRQGTKEASAYAHYLRGRGYLEDFAKPENIDSAIAEFGDALQQDPYYVRALAGLGEADWRKYEATNDPQWSRESKTNCSRAVELGESESAAHACLGQVLRGTGDYQQAAVQYQRALALEPTSDDAVAGLAATYASLDNPREAEATFRKAIALRPRYWLGYNSLGGFYFSQARYADAAQMFAQVVSIAPDSFRAWSNLGGTYVMEGQYQQAIDALQRSISIRPTYAAYSNLATAYFELRRFDDAANECTQALRLDEGNYLVWGNLGSAYYYAGRHGDAAKAFAKAVSLAEKQLAVNPRDTTVLGNLASYYSSLGQTKRAADTVSEAVELAPSDPDVLLDAAMVYIDSNHDLALKYLGDALLHGLSVTTVLNAPAFDNLRNNAQFESLLERYGKPRRQDVRGVP